MITSCCCWPCPSPTSQTKILHMPLILAPYHIWGGLPIEIMGPQTKVLSTPVCHSVMAIVLLHFWSMMLVYHWDSLYCVHCETVNNFCSSYYCCHIYSLCQGGHAFTSVRLPISRIMWQVLCNVVGLWTSAMRTTLSIWGLTEWQPFWICAIIMLHVEQIQYGSTT